MANSITLENVEAGYGSVRVLHDVSMRVDDGETVVLLGSNGNGKSTLIKCITGIVTPSRGRISLQADGAVVDLVGLTPEAIVDLGIALVPEGRRLFAALSVEENLMLGAFRPAARAQIADNLAFVYDTFPVLRERRGQLAGSMSGGEQQMVALGRALMSAPKILLVDEPSVGLAPILVSRVIAKIKELKEQKRPYRADGRAELQPGDQGRRSRLRHGPRPDRVRGPLRRRAPGQPDDQALLPRRVGPWLREHGLSSSRTARGGSLGWPRDRPG